MKFDIDDARLTAYVLDELNASERAEVEAMLREDTEARAFVDSMSGVTEALSAELSANLSGSPDVELGELRKARIAKAAKGSSKRWLVGGGMAVAAAAVALVVVSAKGRGSDERRSFSLATVESQSNSLDHIKLYPQSDQSAPSGQQRSTNGRSPDSQDPSTASIASQQTTVTSTPGIESGGSRAPVLANNVPWPEKTRGMDENTRRQLESLGYYSGDEPGYTPPAYTPPPPVEVPIDNAFIAVAADPLSTFSIDVDTASYSQIRQSLRSGRMPAPSLVRIEELINYFDYKYPSPKQDEPFAAAIEVSQAPWNSKNKLVRIGIKAKGIAVDRRPRANLVFLLDVSGSMRSEDKLPLLKRSLEMLLTKLNSEDRIAIVVYAGASGLALDSTSAANPQMILSALRRLKSGGSTNGSAGIELAYNVAQENFIEGGVNRVILATDGDFNVGTTSRSELTKLIAEKAKKDVFLTVLGFGISSSSDGTMEQLADKGNGNYAFIDTLAEAKKVLVDQVQSTLVTVAKDVKLQVEFNPKRVSEYRLIGYENRVLADKDFNNDAKDAGEIGAGHTVTALYEIVPPNVAKVDSLRYQTVTATSTAADSDELLTLKLRYKEPTGDTSRKKEIPVFDSKTKFAASSTDFKFASAVAAFGMILRGSPHSNNVQLSQVLDWASAGRGNDSHEYRAEFLQLIRKAIVLQDR